MNSTEQHQHRRVTDDLDQRLTNVEEVLTALDTRVSEVAIAARKEITAAQKATAAEIERAMQRAFGASRDLITEETAARRADVLTLTEAAQETRGMVRGLRDRTFWGRWRWLLTGH